MAGVGKADRAELLAVDGDGRAQVTAQSEPFVGGVIGPPLLSRVGYAQRLLPADRAPAVRL